MTQLACDIAVVGASVAGCTTATLFARQGLRVVLLERSSDPKNFKRICTHFIQPSAVPTIDRLGVGEALIAAGGKRNLLEIWTKWGWIHGSGTSRGYNLRREKLDPLLRTLAASTAGVEFLPGHTARALTMSDGRVTGLQVERHAGQPLRISARLVVGADGRDTRIGSLAGLRLIERPNNRFTYFTYYRDLPVSATANSRYWYDGENLAYAFENDDDTTLLGVFLPRQRLEEFKANRDAHFVRFWESLEGAPRLRAAYRVSEMRGSLEMANRWRAASGPGVAVVGDAAMSLDPIWGTGCGFAMQSAAWLVDETAPALLDCGTSPSNLDAALSRYGRAHWRHTIGHALHIADFSRVRGSRWIESLLFSAATRDQTLADGVFAYLAREDSVFDFASPNRILRALRVNLATRLSLRYPAVSARSRVRGPLP